MAATKILHWNGHDLPPELAALPPGTYALTAAEPDTSVEDLDLTAEQLRGVREALDRFERGEPAIPADESRSRLQALIRAAASQRSR